MKTYLKILNGLVWIPMILVFMALPVFLGWVTPDVDAILWNAGYKFYYYSAFIAHAIWWVFWVLFLSAICMVINDKIDQRFK